MEIVDKSLIQKYAKRNTSPKIPLESKMVEAFVDSILNSTELQLIRENILSKMQNGDGFIIFNSYWPTAKNISKEPFRSIIAYAMLKKDFKLFELISQSLFTGTVTEYYGTDLYNEIVKNTDEVPTHYTDEGTYTDMNEGMILIGFRDYYVTETLADGTGSEYQTISELEEALVNFENIITICKPARCQVLSFFEPYCFLGGDEITCNRINIATEKKDVEGHTIYELESPFGPDAEGKNTSIEILKNMTLAQLLNCYSTAYMYNSATANYRNIEFSREVAMGNDFVTFQYEFRCQASSDSIWDTIRIPAGASSGQLYIESKVFDNRNSYSERYEPICLRLNDNDPDGPILAFDSSHTIGAMFYRRTKQNKE